ncbi:hypothetical protein SEVIR_4G190400v4 [Setaria viridis]|uniref:putative disease resistance protein At1g59780 n=1 Tax=Setaria viridis TaxID=4556 RepID=UPI0014936F62|nr:disease resistance protein Pik-2-like isoform X1 [Setaria viridis]XP_034589060.1 disease resistance protein Pik-2-like isoform X1 [Setaria viridis]
MLETVLSMARSMLGSAISKAAAAAAEEMSLLIGVQKEIWFMKDELETMQAFLVAPEVTKKKDKLVKVWAKQVRDLSYDIEDCLDEFTVHVGSQRLSRQLMKLKDRHRIAVQIRNLKSRVEEVSRRNARYNLIRMDASNNTTDETESYMEDIRNHSASNTDEAQLVGFAATKQKLIEMINMHGDGGGHARVICVVGMGGLGKTTLARKTYESKEDIAKQFSCCAWITVSRSFSKAEMLKDMIRQLLGNEVLKECLKELEGKGLQIEDLASYLRKRLNEKRWIAEGFVRARIGMTIEDVGECYFNELVKRSMVQPSRVNLEGHVKSCRVHDIMRDIIVSISREENFVYSSEDNIPRTVEENFHHVVFHGSNYPTLKMDWSRVRSLTFFGERPMGPARSFCFAQLRMLRALDLGSAEFAFTQKEINNIGLLPHLKYVNVRCGQGYSNIYALPRSIGKLQGLQTLDIRYSHISALPTEICKLQSLRSLRCRKIACYECCDLPKVCMTEALCIPKIFTALAYSEEREEIIADLHMAYSSRWSRTYGVRIPIGISKLRELQILEVVDIKRTDTKSIEELGELCQLRKLSVSTKGATDKKCKNFCKAIQKLSSLRSLSVDGTDDSVAGTLEWMGSAFSPPPLLTSLRLYGYIGEMPNWFRNLAQLVKILLFGSKLEEGKAMEILGALPNLIVLCLYEEAYVGEKLVFAEGAFLSLRKLDIRSLDQLREMRFEEGGSPQMESIEIWSCRLESGITGINHLPRLKGISLGYRSKVARLGTLQEEVNAHGNQPVLRLQEDRSYHGLREVEGFDVLVQATEPVPDHAQVD